MALTSHLEYSNLHYPSVHKVIQAPVHRNHTSIGVHINSKSIDVYINIERSGVAYANNVELVHKNYKSIIVAYNNVIPPG
jgi:hypothetical protein